VQAAQRSCLPPPPRHQPLRTAAAAVTGRVLLQQRRKQGQRRRQTMLRAAAVTAAASSSGGGGGSAAAAAASTDQQRLALPQSRTRCHARGVHSSSCRTHRSNSSTSKACTRCCSSSSSHGQRFLWCKQLTRSCRTSSLCMQPSVVTAQHGRCIGLCPCYALSSSSSSNNSKRNNSYNSSRRLRVSLGRTSPHQLAAVPPAAAAAAAGRASAAGSSGSGRSCLSVGPPRASKQPRPAAGAAALCSDRCSSQVY
jgi:hypothetical protein